ncbi:Uncharacterized protein Rs2_28817 [Raphanus sativus]|nr:Uncharacterized protein Rs2_28817 [Raphanus sativus]
MKLPFQNYHIHYCVKDKTDLILFSIHHRLLLSRRDPSSLSVVILLFSPSRSIVYLSVGSIVSLSEIHRLYFRWIHRLSLRRDPSLSPSRIIVKTSCIRSSLITHRVFLWNLQVGTQGLVLLSLLRRKDINACLHESGKKGSFEGVWSRACVN